MVIKQYYYHSCVLCDLCSCVCVISVSNIEWRSISVNALRYKYQTSIILHLISSLFTSVMSHSAQKHNFYLNNLFCSLSPNKSSKLEAAAACGLESVPHEVLFFLKSVSPAASLSWGEWSSWSCGSCLKSFSPSACSDWQLRSTGQPLAWIPGFGPLQPALIQAWSHRGKPQCRQDGFDSPRSSHGCPKCFHSGWTNPSYFCSPCCPDQMECDMHTGLLEYVFMTPFCYICQGVKSLFVLFMQNNRKRSHRFHWNLLTN